MTILRPSDLTITPWKNGFGRKADLAEHPGWTLGLAWIEKDAPFSDFIGWDRTCILIDGAGFTLTIPDSQPLSFVAPGTAHRFPGESRSHNPIRAQLVDGPCLVLNLMSRRGLWEHEVKVTDQLPRDGYAVILRGTVHDHSGLAGRGDLVALPHDGTASRDLLVVSAAAVQAPS